MQICLSEMLTSSLKKKSKVGRQAQKLSLWRKSWAHLFKKLTPGVNFTKHQVPILVLGRPILVPQTPKLVFQQVQMSEILLEYTIY